MKMKLKATGDCYPKDACLYGIGYDDKAVVRLHPQQKWKYMQITNRQSEEIDHINVKRDFLVLHLELHEFYEMFDVRS
jgi:hypothetical protein